MKTKLVLSLTSLVLVAAVAVGGTMAYMQSKTQTMTNNFQVVGGPDQKGVSGELREPTWDGYDFGEKTAEGNQPDGTVAKSDSADLGINQAEAIVPGDSIPKDPQLKNTGAIDAYMAIKVTYGENFSTIADALTINNGWTKAEGYSLPDNTEIYFYTGATDKTAEIAPLAVGDTTSTALFSNVSIKTSAGNEISGEDFDIQLLGGAVQSKNLTTTQAKQQLVDLLTA